MPRQLQVGTLAIALALSLATRADSPAIQPAPAPETGEAKLAAARKSIDRMREQLSQVETFVDQARKDRDIVKLSCVNEKLAQERGLVKVSEQAARDLEKALQRRDDDAALQLYSKVDIASRKVVRLRADAEQCIGQLAFYTDDRTVVEVVVPDGVANTDPTWFRTVADLEDRPPPASGF